MPPKNLEFLFESENYHYYAREEIGFTNKKFACKNKLYEDFGDYYSSTYLDIFTVNLYSSRKITQLWVFLDKKPVGLFLGIHYPEFGVLIDEQSELPSYIVGEMHLFTLPEYRKRGIATKAIPILENLMLSKTIYPPCLIMQDDAYPLGIYLKKSLALPKNYAQGVCSENLEILNEKYCSILQNEEQIKSLLKQFPALKNHESKNKKIVGNTLFTVESSPQSFRHKTL